MEHLPQEESSGSLYEQFKTDYEKAKKEESEEIDKMEKLLKDIKMTYWKNPQLKMGVEDAIQSNRESRLFKA